MSEELYTIPIDNGRNYIIIEDSRGIIDQRYKSYLRDDCGFGCGDTVVGAAKSVVNSIRRYCDKMDAAIKEWESKNV